MIYEQPIHYRFIMRERHTAAVLIGVTAFGKVRLVFYVENEIFIDLCLGQAL